MGLETSEPVLEPWFVNRAPGSARRDLRAGICAPGSAFPVLEHRAPIPRPPIPRPPIPRSPIPRSPIPRSLLPWRTVSGCNRQTSHCARFVKTRLSSLRPWAAIRAPLQCVIAHHARQACACYCPMGRTSLIFSRVSFSAFPIPARACLLSGITYNVRRVLDTDSVQRFQ